MKGDVTGDRLLDALFLGYDRVAMNKDFALAEIKDAQTRRQLEALGDEYYRILAKVFGIDTIQWQESTPAAVIEWLWSDVTRENVYDDVNNIRVEAALARWRAAEKATDDLPASAVTYAMRAAAECEAEKTYSSLVSLWSREKQVYRRHRRCVAAAAQIYWSRYQKEVSGRHVLRADAGPDLQISMYRRTWSRFSPPIPLSEILTWGTPEAAEEKAKDLLLARQNQATENEIPILDFSSKPGKPATRSSLIDELERAKCPPADWLPWWITDDAVEVFLDQLCAIVAPHRHEGNVAPFGIVHINPEKKYDAIRKISSSLNPKAVHLMCDGSTTYLAVRGTNIVGVLYFPSDGRSDIHRLSEFAHKFDAIVMIQVPDGSAWILSREHVLRHQDRRWHLQPTISQLVQKTTLVAGMVDSSILAAILRIAVLELSTRGIGTTIVWMLNAERPSASDKSYDLDTSNLNVNDAGAVASIVSLVRQIDGALIIDKGGRAVAVGVHLQYSERARQIVSGEAGTRHTSAKRFSFDRDSAVVVTVSTDRHVTVYSDGRSVADTNAHAGDLATAFRRMVPAKKRDVSGETYEMQCPYCGKTSSIDVAYVAGGWDEEAGTDCEVCGRQLDSRDCMQITSHVIKVFEK